MKVLPGLDRCNTTSFSMRPAPWSELACRTTSVARWHGRRPNRGGSASLLLMRDASRPAPDEAGRPDTRGTGTAVLSRCRPARGRWEARSGSCGCAGCPRRRRPAAPPVGVKGGVSYVICTGLDLRLGLGLVWGGLLRWRRRVLLPCGATGASVVALLRRRRRYRCH